MPFKAGKSDEVPYFPNLKQSITINKIHLKSKKIFGVSK